MDNNMSIDSEKQLELTESKRTELKKKSFFSRLNPFSKKIEDEEVLEFTRSFASLAKDGIPLLTSLDTLENKTENVYLKKILRESKERVKNGTELYICLRKYNDVFDEFYCDLIKTGEENGRLDQVLERLSILLGACIDVDRKVFETIEFPTRVTIYSFFEIVFLMAYVVPRFSILYEGFNIPEFTRVIIDLGFWFQSNMMNIFGIITSVVLFYLVLRLTKVGRFITDFFKMNIPVFGKLLKKHSLIHYSRNIVTLFNSGISFISSMKLCNEKVKNTYLKKVLGKINRDIEKGKSITNAFDEANFLPRKSINIIETGEESGYIDEIFTEIANNYERETFALAKMINVSVKPIYVVIMSVLCGAVFLGLCMPLYALIKGLAPK